MTTVSVINKGQRLRPIRNIDNQVVNVPPGKTLSLELHPYVAALLQREAAKETADIEIVVNEVEQFEHELNELRAANAQARRNNRKGIKVVGARALPPIERQPKMDRRFFVDPQTVHPSPDADPVLRDDRPPSQIAAEREELVREEKKKSRQRASRRVPLKSTE